jgi:hypothetical protein
MGMIYDALLRAETARREGVASTDPSLRDDPSDTKGPDSTRFRVAALRDDDAGTGSEIVERLASLEVAVYALLDRLDLEPDRRELRPVPAERTRVTLHEAPALEPEPAPASAVTRIDDRSRAHETDADPEVGPLAVHH